MPDTNRSKADLAAILADNTTALISPQDVRDFLESVFTLGTKGDLAGIDVAGLRQALSIGADGTVLTADAASTLGFKWDTVGAAAHPDLATHDALGLATDAELSTHAGLPNVHHAEDHDHDGSPTQQLLAANTHGSPSADTHHNQSHAHNGADGSGTVAGSDLTGTPGGELGGTWASPTVDASHSGSTHAATQAAAEATAAGALATHAAAADPHTGYLKESDANYIDLTDGGSTALHTHAGGTSLGLSLAVSAGAYLR